MPSVGPRKFDKYFPRLPNELKDRIWRHVMEARLVRAMWENETDGDRDTQIYRLAAGPVPSVLHVCQESRREALKHYVLIKSRLPLRSTRDPLVKHKDHSVYFNLELDTLYFVTIPNAADFLSWVRNVLKFKPEDSTYNGTLLVAESTTDEVNSSPSATPAAATSQALVAASPTSSFGSSKSSKSYIPKARYRYGLQHVAISRRAFLPLTRNLSTHCFHTLFRENSTLKSLSVIWDAKSRYRVTTRPQFYVLTAHPRNRYETPEWEAQGACGIYNLSSTFNNGPREIPPFIIPGIVAARNREKEAWDKWRAGDGKDKELPEFRKRNIKRLTKAVM